MYYKPKSAGCSGVFTSKLTSCSEIDLTFPVLRSSTMYFLNVGVPQRLQPGRVAQLLSLHFRWRMSRQR